MKQFTSLGDGHPEFSGFPYRRGTRILFDHSTHRAENFRMERNRQVDQRFECEDCHRPDAEGRAMLLRPFEQTCIVCHGAQVGEGPGLVVVNLTGVDAGAVPSAGRWPSEEETWPSPLMALLLRGGGVDAADLALLDEIDPLDLSDTGPEEREAVGRYMAAVRGLIEALGQAGQAAFDERVQVVLELEGPPPPEASGQLPPDTFGVAVRAWFAGEPAPSVSTSTPGASDSPDRTAHGGWYRRDSDFTIRYRPSGHDDRFLRSWIELAAGHAGDPDAAALLAVLREDAAPGRCLKCHRAVAEAGHATEIGPSGSALVEAGTTPSTTSVWKPFPGSDPRLHFEHATHMRALGGGNTCTRCHVMVADARDQAARTEGLPGSRDFIPMDRSLCVSCHGLNGAGDDCLDCHRYHWRAPAPASVAAVAVAAR